MSGGTLAGPLRSAAGNGAPDTEGGFGVYLHWPFCAAKCPYCDFNSHVRHAPPDQARYVEAFRRELAALRERTGPRRVGSVFFGGGTPSLMKPGTVGALLDAVSALWSMEDGAEITLEANPSSVEAARFRGYRAAGVNRVSLGVQALNDSDLKMLGRLHDVEQALGAIGLARDIFPRLSFDLIYARTPAQTEDDWAAELERAIDLAADHLSLYQLTIEEGTPFFGLHKAGKLHVPGEEHAARLYAVTQQITAERGLPAYEVSNHAAPGAESRHNLVYWRYGEYAGAGPGAHGRFREGFSRTVTMTEKLPERWLEAVATFGHGIIEEEHLGAAAEGDEMLLMGLRLAEGIDPARYRRLTGRALDEARIAALIGEGMLLIGADGRLRATRDGTMVLDALVADLCW
jgi:putative oxygen-independent coproporphyrinogen III oxidase